MEMKGCLTHFCDSYSMYHTLGPVFTERQRQCCDDTSDTSLIEYNGVAPEWGCNPFWSDSTDFNENCVASVITALTLH